MTAAELVLISLLFFLEVKGDCPSETCQKISLNVHQDSEQDTEFAGHVFHNSITLNPVQCYMWCIRDCRCLSINYKENPQNDTKYCELNEGNHFISKSSLVKSSGSRYFALRKEHSKVKVRMGQRFLTDTKDRPFLLMKTERITLMDRPNEFIRSI